MLPESDEAWLEDAEIVVTDDEIYDGVVIAAFGGMWIKLTKDVQIRMHPLWIFLLSLPLFITQVSLLMFLRIYLVVDLIKAEKDDTEKWQSEMLIRVAIVMVVVVQVIMFREILAALRVLIFAMNPMTWKDVKRIEPNEVPENRRWIYNPMVLAPLATLALILKLAIGYLVAVDSVSIIISSKNPLEVIFNSLAITFIADLDVNWWKCCCTILHIKAQPDFHIQLWPAERRKQAWMKLPRCMQCFAHGHGGTRLEVVVTFVGCFLIYSRQLFIILFALETRTLPVVRDICTSWRWRNGKSQHIGWLFQSLAWLGESTLIVKMHERVDSLVADVGEEKCSATGEWRRMQFADVVGLVWHNPHYGWTTMLCLGFIASVLLLPQLVFGMNTRIKAFLAATASHADQHHEEALSNNQLSSLRSEIALMRKDQAQAEQEIFKLREALRLCGAGERLMGSIGRSEN